LKSLGKMGLPQMAHLSGSGGGSGGIVAHLTTRSQ
jgi:hypothetical protein